MLALLAIYRYLQEDEHTLTYYEIFEDRKSFYEVSSEF